MVARLVKLSVAAFVLVAIVAAAGGVSPAASGSTVREKSEPVDINSASAADQESPGTRAVVVEADHRVQGQERALRNGRRPSEDPGDW